MTGIAPVVHACSGIDPRIHDSTLNMKEPQ